MQDPVTLCAFDVDATGRAVAVEGPVVGLRERPGDGAARQADEDEAGEHRPAGGAPRGVTDRAPSAAGGACRGRGRQHGILKVVSDAKRHN